MIPELIFADGEELFSGTNRFYGIRAIVRKFLFFKKTVIAVNSIRSNSPMMAFKALMERLTPEEQKKATYQCFIQTVDVYGWCNGQPLTSQPEPTWWHKWNYVTLMEKSKGW